MNKEELNMLFEDFNDVKKALDFDVVDIRVHMEK